jgi:hypothetical protein
LDIYKNLYWNSITGAHSVWVFLKGNQMQKVLFVVAVALLLPAGADGMQNPTRTIRSDAAVPVIAAAKMEMAKADKAVKKPKKPKRAKPAAKMS